MYENDARERDRERENTEKNFTKCKRQNEIIKYICIDTLSQCKDGGIETVRGTERESKIEGSNEKKSNVKEANYKHTETKELNYKTSSAQKNIETWKNPNGNVITATPNSQALWFCFCFYLCNFCLFFSSYIFVKAYQVLFSCPWIQAKIFKGNFVCFFFPPFSFYIFLFLSTFPFY